MLVRYQHWRQGRSRRHAAARASWLDCKGAQERSAAASRRTLRLYQCIRVGLLPFPLLVDDVTTAVVAPQSKERFWFGLKVSLSPWWIGVPGNLGAFLSDATEHGVSTPLEVFEWLRGCRYARDRRLFGTEDHWQLPSEFERRRQGDCEDSALWAWNQLAKLGVDGRLVLGKWGRPSTRSRHAWVSLPWSGAMYVLDGACCDKRTNLIAEEQARKQYLPLFSVDCGLQIHWHG